MPKLRILFCYLYFLPKHKHLVILAPVLFNIFGNGGTVLVFVPKLDDVEAASVHIEVDVTLLEVRRDGLPDTDFGMHSLHSLPSHLSDALAMAFR